MISTRPTTPLDAVLADFRRVPLLIGREAATELGLAVLEFLEGTPTREDIASLAGFAARHDESSPARDALVSMLLNASGTLPAAIAATARHSLMAQEWGGGRETAALTTDPRVDAVPRRKALAERLLAERARRIRPRMHAVVADVLMNGAAAVDIPTWFLARNWIDLRDALAQRARSERVHREQITRWLVSRPADVRARFQPVEDALIDVATQAILHTPETAPLAPYLGHEIVTERVRSATNFRGAPARARLACYLARLTPGTEWYDTIKAIALPGQNLRAG